MSKVDISTCQFDYKAAQCQDKWIIDLTNAKTDGYFVEAGAADGIRSSNTYVLEKHLNWQGICVEPIDGLYEMLIKNRNICENICLYSEEKEIEFLEFVDYSSAIKGKGGYDYSGYSGIKKHIHISRRKRLLLLSWQASLVSKEGGRYWDDVHKMWTDVKKGKTIKKHTMTLESLLDKHNAPNIIDYISLDTEGSEFAILKNFPFNKYTVMAFSIENRYCSNLLKHKGYIVVKNKFDPDNKHEYYYIHPNHQSIKK
mgnify:CR=1 FL=1|jgi:hypothetical protein